MAIRFFVLSVLGFVILQKVCLITVYVVHRVFFFVFPYEALFEVYDSIEMFSPIIYCIER